MSYKKKQDKDSNIEPEFKEWERIVRCVMRFGDAAPLTKMDVSNKLYKDYMKCNPNPIFVENISSKLQRLEYHTFNEIDNDFEHLWSQEEQMVSLKHFEKNKENEVMKRYQQCVAIKHYYEIMASPLLKGDILNSKQIERKKENAPTHQKVSCVKEI